MAIQKTSDVYKKLYHYTNWDGLYGILENQSLWATHCRFLNDKEEVLYFGTALEKALRPYFEKEFERLQKEIPDLENFISSNGGLDAIIQHEAKAMVNSLYYATGNEFYISSFCGEHKKGEEDKYVNDNGLLSQWRGYGKDGGFALVFDTRKIEEILALEFDRFDYTQILIPKCLYSAEELEAEYSNKLHLIAEYITEGYRLKISGNHNLDDPPESYIRLAGKALTAFVTCASSYKHRGFNEENEVRIVALFLQQQDAAQNKQDKERKLRGKSGRVIPYIELFNSLDISLPIERIIVGPHKEKEERAAALRIILGNKIEVTASDIPYIGFG